MVNKYGNAIINPDGERAKVLRYIKCRNAHIYVIDRVLDVPLSLNVVYRATVADMVLGAKDPVTEERTLDNIYNGALDKFAIRAQRAMADGRNLGGLDMLDRIGPKRSKYVVFAPSDNALRRNGRALLTYARRHSDVNANAYIVREHICRLPERTDRTMLLAAAKEQDFECTNLNGNVLTVSIERYNRKKKNDDGLRVNGVQVLMPNKIDVLARNGAVLIIDNVLMPSNPSPESETSTISPNVKGKKFHS